MSIAHWTEADSQRAQQIWADYVAQHDVTGQLGKTAGVDPVSGRIWMGESAAEIVNQMDVSGVKTPLYFIRVGQDAYLRKGGRR